MFYLGKAVFPRRALCVLGITALAAMSLSVDAAVIPVYSQVYVEVGTHVDPNEDDQTNTNQDDQLALIDPMSIGASTTDASEDDNGENQAYVDGNASVSWPVSADEGSALLFATWQAGTTKSPGDSDTGGGFYVDLQFLYTFQVDVLSTVVIHANVTAVGNTIFPFLANNVLEFDGDVQSINPSPVTGIFNDTFIYVVNPGEYSLYYSGYPNVGTSYLNDDETMTVTIDFTIYPGTDIPEPASVALALGGLALLARRRSHA